MTSTETVLNHLARHVEKIARLPEAEQAWDELENAIASVEAAVDSRAPATYAGRCEACGRDLYAKPAAEEAVCRPCNLRHSVEGQRSAMLDELSDKLVRSAEAARIIPTLSGLDVTRQNIDVWAHRGTLVAHGRDATGRPLYRVSEVLEVTRRAAVRRGQAGVAGA